MRVIAKQGSCYLEIFNGFFKKGKDRMLIVESQLLKELHELIPTGENFHSHFNYVENGNYHFSIKYFDTVENKHIERRNFYNHISIEKSNVINSKKIEDGYIKVPSRSKNYDDPLDMFMNDYQLEPWSNIPLGFSPGVIAFSSASNKLSSLAMGKWLQESEIKSEDLVVDFDLYENSLVNFKWAIFNKGNNAFESELYPEGIKEIHKSVEDYGMVFIGVALIIPTIE